MATNEFNIIKCPVCGTVVTDGVCQQCGWVHILFPAEVPDKIKQFESHRVDVLRRIKQEMESEKDASAQLEKTIERLHMELKQARQELELKRQELAKKQTQGTADEQNITMLKRQIDDLSAKLDTAQKRLYSKDNDIKSLNSTISSKDIEITELKRTVHELKSTPATAPQKTLCGIVTIENTNTNSRICLPVYEGTNTYGANPTRDNHQHFNSLERGLRIEPIHFSVSSRVDKNGITRLFITDLTGRKAVTLNALPIPPNGVYTSATSFFYLSANVRVHVSAYE